MKVAVYCVLAVNVIGLAALLVQGCKREQPLPPPETQETMPIVEDTTMPPADTNMMQPAPVEPMAMTPAPEPEPVPAPAAGEYIVVKGDSFYSIGKKLGVPWKAIADANPGVDSTKLKIGQKLVIPAASTASAPAADMNTAMGETIYVVKSGDTLTKIAKDFGTTYKAIKAANGLVTDRIKVGDKLKIPAKEAAPAPAPEPALAPAYEPAPAPAPESGSVPAQ